MNNALRSISDLKISLAEAREYKRLGQEIEALEKRRKELKERFETVIWAAGGQMQVGPYVLSVSEQERESFSIKNAVQSIGRDVLVPFISKTAFTVLRIKVTDVNEDEAC
jgi:hypothetical protein